jgi:hypothetical protein
MSAAQFHKRSIRALLMLLSMALVVSHGGQVLSYILLKWNTDHSPNYA